MKEIRAVLLMPDTCATLAARAAEAASVHLDMTVVADQASLLQACSIAPDLVLAFGTGIIVPQSILSAPGILAINIHPASPEYPGRDPHHFASYDGATQYGATMHHMTSRVDAGPIVDVELFDVSPDASPSELLALANKAGVELLHRLFIKLGAGLPLSPIKVSWGKRKTTRKMFLDMCRVDNLTSKEEFARRLRATSMPGYSNLFIEMHGKRFRLEE